MSNKTYAELFQSSDGGSSSGGWVRPIISSKTITFTQPGSLVISMVGGGGGGAVSPATNGSGTGGNSAPWGRKKVTVSAGDVLVVTIGAGGIKGAAAGTTGAAGSTSTVVLNGATIMTVPGGEGGNFSLASATATAPTPAAAVTGADFWASGLQAGSAQVATGGTVSGGAAVDVLMTGLGCSPNATTAGASAAIGGSVGTDAGGIPYPWVAMAEWGMVITDSATASTTVGAPGRGATPSTNKAGPFGGGGGSTSTLSPGEIGAGGGAGAANPATAGAGGDAYAYVTFTPSA